MFCPRCSAQNEKEQKYCRHCGLPLSSVLRALEGRTDEGVARYEKAIDWFLTGNIILGLGALGAILGLLLGSEPRGYGALIFLLLGLAVAIPAVIAGLARFIQGERLLKPKEPPRRPLDEWTPQSDLALPSAPTTDPLAVEPALPGSVTEQTTRDLKQPEPRR